MPNLWIIFLTGLTTGGLSCLAVQGGLLANVIANQADDDTLPAKPKTEPELSNMSKRALINYYENHRDEPRTTPSLHRDLTLSIILFLSAKVVAYTLLGAGLGWLGTMIQLTPVGRGVLLLVIALFMVCTALRLLNVHPIFNIFQLQPPKSVRKWIRSWSKNSREDFATPLFLGTLTVLIPCGITQAMMAVAIGTGSPVAGAVTMLAFTLGTTPLFFFLAYFATRLGENLNRYFARVVAVLLIIFALYSLESGLNLVGSPVSLAAYKQWQKSDEQIPSTTTTTPAETPQQTQQVEQVLKIDVNDDGYEPRVLKAKANTPTKLALTTNNTNSCSRAFVIPSLRIQKVLDETGTEEITIPPQPKGKLRYSCSMGMYTGQIIFE